MDKLLMLSFGELGTKGKNKKEFIKRWQRNIASALDGLQVEVIDERDRCYIKAIDTEFDQALSNLRKVSGIKNIAIVNKLERAEEKQLSEIVLLLVKNLTGTFKVITRRADKSFPINSDAVNRMVAGVILDGSDLKVDIHKPDHLINIEIRHHGIYIYLNKELGMGGYPLGSLGRGLVCLSGGIDSPVAAFQFIRRGIQIEVIHFASPPYTSQAAVDKIFDLVKVLTGYQRRIVCHIIPFTKIQLAINEKVNPRFQITIMRRMMYRIAELVARERSISIVGSGDSIGQVASQTVESLDVISAATTIPIIRPLALIDKEEIIKQAKDLGTYDISIRPFEDCCTIFTPKSPIIKPKLTETIFQEGKVDYQNLLVEAVAERQVIVSCYKN